MTNPPVRVAGRTARRSRTGRGARPGSGAVPAERAPPRGIRRPSTRRVLLATLPPAAVVGYGVWKWPDLLSAGRALAGADPTWLLLGVGAVVLTYVAGAASQQGTVAFRLPLRRLFTAQLAGVCANAALPAGLGAAIVSHRFLRRCGISRSDAVTAVALNGVAGVAVYAVVLASFCLAAPDRLPLHRPALGTIEALALSAAVLVATAAAGWAVAGGRGRTALAGLRRQLADIRRTLTNRRRAALLWGGSAAVPLLHATTIAAVLHAVDRPMPVVDVFIAYFAASAVAALVPSPGSVGSLDIVLGLTLTGVGADPQTALTAVLGYRLLGTWLPLLPSALALARLRTAPGAGYVPGAR